MSRFLKIALRVVLFIALILSAAAIWKREEITRLMAVNSLFDAEKIVHNFSHMDEAFLNTPISRGQGSVSELVSGRSIELPAVVNDWIKARNVTSLIVLKDGQIVYEDYFLGTGADDRRISWSVAKSFLSALVGILLEDGTIGSIDDPVIKYAPLLKGSAYEATTLRNVLQMSSGVTFDEDYLDKSSDINRMGREIALGGSLDDFAAGLKDSFAKPGTVMQYVSIDTHVISMVVRGATGRSVTDLISEKIVTPLGFEKQPYYITDGEGVAFALGGLNLTTRDYARFGLMVAQDGQYGGQQVVPKAWLRASTRVSAKTKPGDRKYGYQWWIPATDATEGEFFAHGIYGQYIYINRPLGVVIASNAADRGFKNEGVGAANIEAMRLIARGL
jgi:CubicO group peptidase (beta-lactamase class C family)